MTGPSSSARGGLGSNDGAIAVVAALTLSVLLLFSAFVIDLGALRADRALGQIVADGAVTAAAQTYDPGAPGSAREACGQARAYAAVNLGRTLTPVGTGCDAFPVAEVCDPASPIEVRYTSGPYTITIANPVPDGPGLMQDVSYGLDVDGEPCERLGVTVNRTRDFLLAPAGGSGLPSGETNVGAVAVTTGNGEDGSIASLIILQPEGCETISTDGNGSLVDVIGVTIEGVYYPGSITVDTAGGCTHPPSSNIIDPSNGATPGIRASDDIRSHALQLGSPNVGPTFAASIDPQPTPGPPITRRPIDHRYNCMEGYPDDQIWSPAAHPQLPDAVEDCDLSADGAPPEPYIQALVTAYQTLGAGTVSADWSVYPDDLAGDDASCDGLGSSTADFDLGPAHEAGAGNGRFWFVDCDTFDPVDIRFLGVEAVVTRGAVTVTNNDRMTVQGDSATGAILYVQDGEFRRQGAQSEVVLEDTFVYLHDGPARMISGNQAELTWNAPTLDMAGACPTEPDTPNAACFAPLALWSNSDEQHEIGGSPTLDVLGTFFTPNAEYWLHGGGGQDLRGAQFFTGRLLLSGNTHVVLEPNPDTNVSIPSESRDGLIR